MHVTYYPYAQGVHRCDLSLMEMSFDQTLLRCNIKRLSSNPERATENFCSINGDYTKTATTKNHHTELVCALLIPCFYTSDFETETEEHFEAEAEPHFEWDSFKQTSRKAASRLKTQRCSHLSGSRPSRDRNGLRR